MKTHFIGRIVLAVVVAFLGNQITIKGEITVTTPGEEPDGPLPEN